MSFLITNTPIDTQFQDTVAAQPIAAPEREIVIFNGNPEEMSVEDTLEISSQKGNVSESQQIQKEKINQLNKKLENLTKDQISTETINENPYIQNGKDIYGLDEQDYILLCSVNPNLNDDIIKEFGARAAYFTEKSLNYLPSEMKEAGFKKHGSQAEQEMLADNPYTHQGRDKFGKTSEDYYKMLEEYGYSREIIDQTMLSPRRAYFAHIQNLENNGEKITPLKEVFQNE